MKTATAFLIVLFGGASVCAPWFLILGCVKPQPVVVISESNFIAPVCSAKGSSNADVCRVAGRDLFVKGTALQCVRCARSSGCIDDPAQIFCVPAIDGGDPCSVEQCTKGGR